MRWITLQPVARVKALSAHEEAVCATLNQASSRSILAA
jgi:hypothetical protein